MTTNSTNYRKEKRLLIFVNRLVIFFFSLNLFSLLLYAAGTVQGFTDTTQHSLLSFSAVMGLLLALACLVSIAVEISRFIKSKRLRYIFRGVIYILLLIFGIASVFAATLIMTISKGGGGF